MGAGRGDWSPVVMSVTVLQDAENLILFRRAGHPAPREFLHQVEEHPLG